MRWIHRVSIADRGVNVVEYVGVMAVSVLLAGLIMAQITTDRFQIGREMANVLDTMIVAFESGHQGTIFYDFGGTIERRQVHGEPSTAQESSGLDSVGWASTGDASLATASMADGSTAQMSTGDASFSTPVLSIPATVLETVSRDSLLYESWVHDLMGAVIALPQASRDGLASLDPAWWDELNAIWPDMPTWLFGVLLAILLALLAQNPLGQSRLQWVDVEHFLFGLAASIVLNIGWFLEPFMPERFDQVKYRPGEPGWMTAGRFVGDILSMLAGLWSMGVGGGMLKAGGALCLAGALAAGGGAAVTCPISVPLLLGGTLAVGYGVMTTTTATGNAVQHLTHLLAAVTDSGPEGPRRTVPTGKKGDKPTGTPRQPRNSDPEEIRSTDRENEAANILADQGYTIESEPGIRPGKGTRPDYLMEGNYWDCKAPSGGKSIRNMFHEMRDEVKNGQAERFVLNLDDSIFSAEDIAEAIAGGKPKDVRGIEEIIVIKDKTITHVYP